MLCYVAGRPSLCLLESLHLAYDVGESQLLDALHQELQALGLALRTILNNTVFMTPVVRGGKNSHFQQSQSLGSTLDGMH